MKPRRTMARSAALIRAGLLALVLAASGAVAGTSLRTTAAEEARAGLAVIDSLLAADQAGAAAEHARRLQARLGTDPLYGWQIEGRLGLALLRAGHPAEALPHLEAVMRRHPTDPVAHRNLAVALWQMGRKGRALTEFQVVVELAPADPQARLEYGQILAEFGDVAAAVEEFEVARRLCPGCEEPDRQLAAAYLTAEQFAAAVPPLERLRSRGDDPWVRQGLAQALAGAGRQVELLDFLASLAPEGLNPLEWYLAVQGEASLGGAVWSLAAYDALADPTRRPPCCGVLPEDLLTDAAFWGRVAHNLIGAERYEEGLGAADRAVELDPGHVVYRNNRVVLLLKLDRPEEAAREWEEVLRLDPSLEEKK